MARSADHRRHRALPEAFGARLDLLEQRTFPAGWVHLRCSVDP